MKQKLLWVLCLAPHFIMLILLGCCKSKQQQEAVIKIKNSRFKGPLRVQFEGDSTIYVYGDSTTIIDANRVEIHADGNNNVIDITQSR